MIQARIPPQRPSPGPQTKVSYRTTQGKPSGYVLGLDLGKSQDFSALIVLEVIDLERIEMWQEPHSPEEFEMGRKPLRRFHAVKIHRWALGTPYTVVTEDLRALMAKLPHKPGHTSKPELVADRTGVGAPVVEALAKLGLDPVSVSITAGSAPSQRSERDWTVPKSVLASAMDVVLSEERFRVPQSSEWAGVLAKELRAFRAKKTAAGNDSFEAWREADHDDLVLAAALAVWWADERPQPVRSATIGWRRM